MPSKKMIEQDPEELDYGVSSDGVVRSSWANLTPRIVELIQANRSTIIFCKQPAGRKHLQQPSMKKQACSWLEPTTVLLHTQHSNRVGRASSKWVTYPQIVATASLEARHRHGRCRACHSGGGFSICILWAAAELAAQGIMWGGYPKV